MGGGLDFSSLLEKYPRKNDAFITYGTAGFRTKAEELGHVVARMGVVAALRSLALGGRVVGVMVTASHNPESDNGLKLTEPNGEMLTTSWELKATTLANASDEDFTRCVLALVSAENIDLTSTTPSVFIGRDTRWSSEDLSEAASAGARTLGAQVTNQGVLTTPMLHYAVSLANQMGGTLTPDELRFSYYQKLSRAFNQLNPEKEDLGNYEPVVSFDGANGVGAIAMKELAPHLNSRLRVDIYNDVTKSKGKLNYMCGADYVKTKHKCPDGIEIIPGRRCLAVDGDADRVVYFYIDAHNKFHLLDGDRIASIIAAYLMNLVKLSGISVNLGLVQTAYANANSTNYMKDKLGVPVTCVSTGVKHLHHKAVEFDIGVYFEANGHGTVVFSMDAKEAIRCAINDTKASEASRAAAVRLKNCMDLINETVGDGLSDFLLVETILRDDGWSAADWEAQYHDLPNTLRKVVVKDRTAIETTDAERRCVRPAGLQERIDELVAATPQGRAFVRPSGTEDVVRVYAEAATRDGAESLANNVAAAVSLLAGGHPQKL